MGIQGLNMYLKDKFPSVHKEVSLQDFQYKKVAIDTSLYMFKFKTVFGEEGWLKAFINLVCCLRKNEIHCIFIYDTAAPVEKTAERNERKEKREKLAQDALELEEDIGKYEVDNVLSERCQKILQKVEKTRPIPKLLLGGNSSNKLFNLAILREELEKKKKQAIQIKPQDYDLTRTLFEIMDIPFLFAPGEAECFCSHLCLSGLVDAVLSEDSDVMAYGAPVFLSKINTSSETVVEVNYQDLLLTTDMTKQQFRDFCIMCGTDYNKNIPKVGPVMSFKLIKEFDTIDKLPKEKYDISILNHKRVREIFGAVDMPLSLFVPYCGKPQYEKLEEFCFLHNCRIDMEWIKKINKPNIIFVSE
jgi:5'-3' exonuclease